MDFRNIDHPNCGPCLHVLDNAGGTVLELPQLTRESHQPHPPLGYEVWSYAGDDQQLGTVTYHATEEPTPWCFQVYTSRYRAAEGAKSWFPTLPEALAGSWARGLELLHETEKGEAIEIMFDAPRYPTVGTYPNRVLEDEQFLDHSLPHLACSVCGDEDCPGSDPRDPYPPCVPVCLCCGRLPDDCPGNVAEFFAEQDRKP